MRYPWHVWTAKQTPSLFRGEASGNWTGHAVFTANQREYAGINEARKAARIHAWADAHFALLEGLPTPSWDIRITHEVKRKDGCETVGERWKVIDGKAVRTKPGPMPEHKARPKGPALKPALVPAEDLPTAWDMMFMLDPAQAVGLIEQGRRVLKSPRATSEWFAAAFGPGSLTLDSLMARIGQGKETPFPRKGYKIEPDSRAALLKRLLRALGSNAWARAESMLRHTTLRCNGHRRKADKDGSSKLVKYTYSAKNGRKFHFGGCVLNHTWRALPASLFRHAKDNYSDRLAEYGYLPASAPSIPHLLAIRATAAKRMSLARQLVRDNRRDYEAMQKDKALPPEALGDKLKALRAQLDEQAPYPAW